MQTRTILVVDDEDRIRTLLNDTLKAKGFDPKMARNGDEALALFQKHEFVLMITDLMLPRIDGFQLIEEVRRLPRGKDLPILLMSAVYRDLKTQNRALAVGVQFLVKPFTLVDFFKKMQSMLELTDGATSAPDKAKPKVAAVAAAAGAGKGPSPQAITGKIDHFSVPLLLVSFFAEQKTGVLEIRSPGRQQMIYLKQGVPVFAKGRARRDTPDAVRDEIRKAISCSTGEYCFEPLETLPMEIPKFKNNFFEMVYEVAHRYYRVDLLIPQFEKVAGFSVMRDDAFEERLAQVPFVPDERQIIDQIDGKKTVSDLVTLGSNRIENVFQILWILQFMGAIRFQPQI